MSPTTKRILTVSFTSLAFVAGVISLTAWTCHRAHDPAEMARMVNNRLDDVLDDVNATPDQRTHIHALASELVTEVQNLHTDTAATHQAVLQAWKSAAPDRASLHALLDKRIDAFRAVAHKALDDGIDVHNTLTPEQRDRITRKIERRMQK